MEKLVNIGEKQRLTRRYLGYLLLAAAALTAYWYINVGINTWWLLGLFIFTQQGVGLVLEARHGVCPANAMRGKQSMDGWFSVGQEDFKKKKLLPQIKQIAIADQMNASLVAFLVATLTLLAA